MIYCGSWVLVNGGGDSGKRGVMASDLDRGQAVEVAELPSARTGAWSTR